MDYKGGETGVAALPSGRCQVDIGRGAFKERGLPFGFTILVHIEKAAREHRRDMGSRSVFAVQGREAQLCSGPRGSQAGRRI